MTTALLLATQAWHDHGWGHDGGPGWWILFPILFWATIIALAVWWFRGHRGGGRSGMGVLAERYARGEIDEAEYRHRRDVLRRRGR